MSRIKLLSCRFLGLIKNIWTALYYNPGHNILRYFDVWQNIRVTTSEKNRDY